MINKKKVYLISLISLGALLICTISYISYRWIYGDKAQENPKCTLEWREKRKKETGYTIQDNPNYQSSPTGYPTDFETAIKEFDSLKFFQARLGTITVGEVIDYLEQNGFIIKDGYKETIRDEVERSSGADIIRVYASSDNMGGSIDFYIEEKMVKGIFFDPAFFIPYKEPYSEFIEVQKPFQSFIDQHRTILGDPQVKYVDDLLDGREIDFYFNKGLVIGLGKLMVFTPTSQVNHEFVGYIGLKYFRNLVSDPCIVQR